MASTKRNSSSQTTQNEDRPFTQKYELKKFTSPLSALPLLKVQENLEKEKERKAHHNINQLASKDYGYIELKLKNKPKLTESSARKRDSTQKKTNREKRGTSPVKLLQDSAAKTKSSNSKSSSVNKVIHSFKTVPGKPTTVEETPGKLPVKKERGTSKKDSGGKEKPNIIFQQSSYVKQLQKHISNRKTPLLRQHNKGTTGDSDKKDIHTEKTNNAIKTNNLNAISKPVEPNNISISKHNLQNEENESQELQPKTSKEKEEAKLKKVSPEMQTKLTVHIAKMIQQKKIFAMGCSNFSIIKHSLLKRGWIQKYACEEPSLKTGVPPGDPEGLFTHRMLRMVPINFIWVYNVSDWNDIKPHTTINRFPRAGAMHSITTKIGLNHNLQHSHWFYELGIAGVKFPRTYSILCQEDLYDFVDDYIMTACTSLLKLVVRSVIRVEHDLLQNGDVPQKTIDFAINRCNDYVAFREHRDIDSQGIGTPSDLTAKEFLKNFYKIVHEGGTLETAPQKEVQGTYLAAKSALQGIQRFRPQTNLDGYKNLWLLKQSNLNCGKGVQILNTLEDIIDAVGEIKSPRYVIQKYIERPLLIYDTKFDIRQWILLTSVNPLQIWMYDACYLRFSSQVFSLCDISESVHLCNNVIQRRYKNGKRHPNLPAENMWDNIKFQKYLVDIGEPNKWDSVIYPGMKECVIATLMAAQEGMVERVNSFELYGVDFMLTEDFRPWLIEVNASPAMGPTTSVTSRLCGQCLEDVIKVVVDRRANPKADTGQFTLIYKQETTPIPKTMPPDFAVVGKRMSLSIKNYKYLNLKTPPIFDLSTTNKGKEFCLKDSPSTSVMSTLMHKKSWISDTRINDKNKQQGGIIPIIKKTTQLRDFKLGDEKTLTTPTTAEFIKSTIISDLIHKTCLLANDEPEKIKGEAQSTRKEINNKNKHEIVCSNSDKNTKHDLNSVKYIAVMKSNNANTTEKSSGNNEEINNNSEIMSVFNTDMNNETKKINTGKGSGLLNNIYVVNSDKIKIVNQVNNMDNVKNIYIVKHPDEKITDNAKNRKEEKDNEYDMKNKEAKLNNDIMSSKENSTNVRETKEINEKLSSPNTASTSNSKSSRHAINSHKFFRNALSKEEKLNKILRESASLCNYTKIQEHKKEESEDEEDKAIQYTIYYNKDRTHFIVDVVENSKKNKQ